MCKAWGPPGKANVVERERAPAFLGEVARVQLSVRFMAQDVTGLLGRVGLQPHSSLGPSGGILPVQRSSLTRKGALLSLGSQQSSSPTQNTLADDACMNAQSCPTLF